MTGVQTCALPIYLYITTEYFLDYMGINHLEELPKVEEVDIDPEEGQLFSERTEELDEN